MQKDLVLQSLINEETDRQNQGIELIASENYPSLDVMEAQGSILTAKYAEGYPGNRYYGGCEVIDKVEDLARDRAKELFGAKYANVQPHSGSQANYAAYHALMPNGGKVLSLVLNDGGHLTHGSPVSFSSHTYSFSHYPLGDEGRLSIEEIKKALDEHDPDVFLAGYSSYPYDIDFKAMRKAIDEHNARKGTHTLFMVDMAHIAGIVSAGLCQNPVEYADVVTSTTHKTLRGPRGGLILSNNEDYFKALDSAVFPYAQGGPLEHVIAAKGVAFLEALQPEFKEYMKKVLENTKTAAEEFLSMGVSSSGSENHLFLLNVLDSYGLNGKEAQIRLGKAGITVNKNMIHNDTLSAFKTSGIRIGFAAATTRGCSKLEAIEIAHLIDRVLKGEDPLAIKKRCLEIASGWKRIESIRHL